MVQESGLKVKTEPVLVRIFTPNFEIEGRAHARPGGYAGRVTDILNVSKTTFMPITGARYRDRKDAKAAFSDAECLVIRVDTIEFLEFI